MPLAIGDLVKVMGIVPSSPSHVVPAVFGWADLEYTSKDCVRLSPGLVCIVVSTHILQNRQHMLRLMVPDGRLFFVRKSEVKPA